MSILSETRLAVIESLLASPPKTAMGMTLALRALHQSRRDIACHCLDHGFDQIIDDMKLLNELERVLNLAVAQLPDIPASVYHQVQSVWVHGNNTIH